MCKSASRKRRPRLARLRAETGDLVFGAQPAHPACSFLCRPLGIERHQPRDYLGRGQVHWPAIGRCHLGIDLLVQPIDDPDARRLGAVNLQQVGNLAVTLLAYLTS